MSAGRHPELHVPSLPQGRFKCVPRLASLLLATLTLHHHRPHAGKEDKGEPVRVSLLAPDLAMSHLQSSRLKFDDLQIQRVLGEGAFSRVYLVRLGTEW